MSIINSFDNNSKPLIDVGSFYGASRYYADVCIVTFSHHVKKMFLKKYKAKKVATSGTANGEIDIYLFKVQDKKLLFYMSPIGAAVAAAVMHEVHYVTGVTKFVVYGSCGVLDNEKCKGKLIVPIASYRDEGLSYHYMEPSDFIEIKNARKLAQLFDKKQYPYVLGKSWTTDALYMETANKVLARKNEGCISVEMESSGLQAICDFYGYELYTFFFGADLFEGECWSKSKLGGNIERDIQKATFDIALQIALYL